MDFCTKLDFLMKLTQMTNKELAAEISVDRSLISLLRTGRRGIPHNKLHIKNMAESFSRRITANYQRQALAETSGMASIGAELPSEILALQLDRWLRRDEDAADAVPEGKNHAAPAKRDKLPSSYSAPAENTLFFYGDEGKREAMRHMMSIISVGILEVFDSTSPEWATSEPSFITEIQTLIRQRLGKENAFTQILPPMSDLNCYTDSLQYMLPIYTRMNTSVYCLPRMIDTSLSFTLIVAPGQCVLFSYGLRSGKAEKITMVSTDRSFVNAHAEQFREYLAQCRSALLTNRDPKKFTRTIFEYLSLNGDICQMTSPLSASSITPELANGFAERSENIVWKEFFRALANEAPALEQSLSARTHIDISPLHSVEEICAGSVPIACPYLPYEKHPRYTAETYALHLENILRLMETYDRYTFIPVSPKSYPGYNLMVNDGGMVLLARGETASPLIMEFRRPEIVMACKEHLMRIIDKNGGKADSRERIKAQLSALIRELRNARSQ